MRAILDLRSNTVLRLCGSAVTSMRTFAMLQMERESMRKTYDKINRTMPALLDKRLAIAELQTTRHIGDTVPAGEFTIIHSEK